MKANLKSHCQRAALRRSADCQSADDPDLLRAPNFVASAGLATRDTAGSAACATRCSRQTRAFTLIEAILALAISAIVLVAIGGVFAGAMRLRDRTTDALDNSLPMTQALTILRRDLQGAIGPSNVLAGDFKCGAPDMGSTMELGSAQGAGVDFFTTTGIVSDNEPWGDIQEVFYQLAMPTDRNAAGKDLVRYVNRNLLATGPSTPEKQWLMGNIESLQVDCFDGGQWRNTWDTSMGDTNLPMAVRVSIRLANNGASQPPIQIIVPLVTLSRTNAIPATGGVQ